MDVVGDTGWEQLILCHRKRVSVSVSQSLTQEAPARVKGHTPPPEWPQQGELVFREVDMRYQENLPLVLNRVTCTIRPKEKVGIVGRTGSGGSGFQFSAGDVLD